MRKWIKIKPAIWITFIPAKMHKNQPAVTQSMRRTVLRRMPLWVHRSVWSGSADGGLFSTAASYGLFVQHGDFM